MQVKKEEMRQTILEIAADEFIKRGYENTSMRVIAQKANTTIGNIYHYFPNKEILLEAIVLPVLEDVEAMIRWHVHEYGSRPFTREEASIYAQHLEELFEESGIACLFDRRVVILLKLESSRLLPRKEAILEELRKHLQDHYQMKDDAPYAKLVLDVMVNSLKHVLTEHENMEEAKAEFLKLFRLFCTGILGQLN